MDGPFRRSGCDHAQCNPRTGTVRSGEAGLRSFGQNTQGDITYTIVVEPDAGDGRELLSNDGESGHRAGQWCRAVTAATGVAVRPVAPNERPSTATGALPSTTPAVRPQPSATPSPLPEPNPTTTAAAESIAMPTAPAPGAPCSGGVTVHQPACRSVRRRSSSLWMVRRSGSGGLQVAGSFSIAVGVLL